MYGKPSNSPAVPIITVIVILFALAYAFMALFAMQIALRCGPACSALMAQVHP